MNSNAEKKSTTMFYLLSVFITFIGNSITFIVCGKYSLDLFGLASVFGALLLLEQFKSMFLSALSGKIVDSYSPKNIAIVCDLACFLLMLICSVFAMKGYVKTSVISSMFILNLIKPFYNTSIFSLVRRISNDSELLKINSRTAVAQQLGSFIGLAFAAYLIAKISLSWLLFIDSISFLISAILLMFCKERSVEEKVLLEKIKDKSIVARRNFKNRIQEYKDSFIANRKLILISTMIGLQINLIIAYNTTLFKMVSERYLEHPSYLSFLEMAYAIAIVIVSLGIEKINFLKLKIKNIKKMFFLQFLVFIVLSVDLSFSAVLILVAVYGAINSLVFPVLFTELYTNTPSHILGKIGGMKGALQALLAIPLLLLNGLLIDYYGFKFSYIFIAVISLSLIFINIFTEKEYEQEQRS